MSRKQYAATLKKHAATLITDEPDDHARKIAEIEAERAAWPELYATVREAIALGFVPGAYGRTESKAPWLHPPTKFGYAAGPQTYPNHAGGRGAGATWHIWSFEDGTPDDLRDQPVWFAGDPEFWMHEGGIAPRKMTLPDAFAYCIAMARDGEQVDHGKDNVMEIESLPAMPDAVEPMVIADSEVGSAAGTVFAMAETDRYRVFNQDCIEGMAERLDADSVALCLSSIPFGALFMYSGKTEDIGNNADGIDMRASQFGLHMRFAIEQIYRVLEPGGIACIHIQQLITTKVQHGYMGRRDLRAATVDLFAAGGFQWTGEFVIPKNPQAMAQRMKLHSLLFETGKRDSRAWAPAMNDYVLEFRKPGEGTPVRALYDAQKNPHGWLSTEEWIRDACGVWADIRETDVLTGWRDAREEDDEKHVCPLQLTVIRRCIRLWSNPDSVVLDPFSGIGSTGVIALEQGRRYVGFELKESYFNQSVRNLELEINRQHAEKTLPLFANLQMEAVG